MPYRNVPDGRGGIGQVEVSDTADAIYGKAEQAFASNATFLALASPTNAQTLTQVQRLTRQVNALLRIVLGHADDASDT